MSRISSLSLIFLLFFSLNINAKKTAPQKHRILISTDIGGTDPDDNQSMMHYLLYCNEFDCEGLVSSPSYGDGSTSEIIRMIGLYEKDLSKLKKHAKGWPKPEYLRSITKQGRHGAAPMQGYSQSTEGSDWIVKCARKEDKRPLYLLVWGGLDDVAQALHDAPDIAAKIRIRWIGGPNKKWSLNSYAYIIENFSNLWFVEDNESYRGFIADSKNPDQYNAGFYEHYVKGAGNLGEDFYSYLKGVPKLGDTPTLLYMMNGDPANPEGESWGGSFEKCAYTPRTIFDRPTTSCDTIQRDGIIEWHFRGPVLEAEIGSVQGTLIVAKQSWAVYYMGNGNYMTRYATYKNGIISYSITSDLEGFPLQSGYFYVENAFPGKHRPTDYKVGNTWWTDKSAPSLYGTRTHCQGAMTVLKWRQSVIEDWGTRCSWLKNGK